MRFAIFSRHLSIALVIASILDVIVYTIEPSLDVLRVALISLLLFVAITATQYFLARNMSLHSVRTFVGGIGISMMTKMILSVVILYVYVNHFQPEGVLYIFPFLIAYICFTIVETMILVKLNNISHSTKKKQL